MRVLVVYCHPDKTSFAAALHVTVTEALAASGHAITDLDLYDEGFNPIFNMNDRAIYGDAPAYHQAMERYARQLAEADAIVLVYPAWWYGMPAMLKGYFDRVWAPGIAYDVAEDGSLDTSRLKRIRRIGVVTTYGSSWWLVRGFMGDPTRKVLARGARHLCGRNCKVEWNAHYSMDRATPEELRRFLDRVRRRMARW